MFAVSTGSGVIDEPLNSQGGTVEVFVGSEIVTQMVKDPITGKFVELDGVEETWVVLNTNDEALEMAQSSEALLEAAQLSGCTVTYYRSNPWQSYDEVGQGWIWGKDSTTVSSGCSAGKSLYAQLAENVSGLWRNRASQSGYVSIGTTKTFYVIANCTGHGTDLWGNRHGDIVGFATKTFTC